MEGERWLTAEEAARACGVTPATLRRWIAKGRLPNHRHPANNRHIFKWTDLCPFAIQSSPQDSQIVLYARVSSRRQLADGDLDRQIRRLQDWATENRPGVQQLVFRDVASGLADNRRGLWAAITACQQEAVQELAVTHLERLARFGTLTMQKLLAGHGVRVIVIEHDPALDGSAESDLVRDMLAVVTSFSGRLYGQRSARAAKLRKCVKTQLRANR